MKKMSKKIRKVIDEFQLELIDMGYSQELRRAYGKVCHLFGEWAYCQSFDRVSEEAIRAYALEKTGCWEAARNLPKKARITLRALVLHHYERPCASLFALVRGRKGMSTLHHPGQILDSLSV
jgi:hypothetical protein